MNEPPHIDDTELLRQLRAGDESGLDGLFRRHYQDLCLRSLRIVGEHKDAEDVVQEFFVNLWNKRSVLPEIDHVAAYLRRSIRNRSLNYLRDQKRVPSGAEEDLPMLTTRFNATGEALEAEELRARINRAIDTLPERCRLVFVLSRFEGLKQREIAEQLKISTKTVENQMSRAYRFLREVLSVSLPTVTTIWLWIGLSRFADQFLLNLVL